jgi:riboflavin synthase
VFTGLIDTVGTVKAVRSRRDYRVLEVHSSYDPADLEIGESMAVDGACLTVVGRGKNTFTVEASAETVSRTILAGYRPGSRVNLERALTAGSRLGGHLVAGHIDDHGRIDHFDPAGDSWTLAVTYDPSYDNLVIDKGSIALNGISLTVNHTRRGWCTMNIIPHTVTHTTLHSLRIGDSVNLEFDMIGKYVVKLASNREQTGLTFEKLKKNGW